METCIYCGAGTRLYDNERPVCVSCLDRIEAGQPLPKKGPVSENSSPDNPESSAAKA